MSNGGSRRSSSRSKEQSDDIDESEEKGYKELNYKMFQVRDFKVGSSNGEFKCPFCPSKVGGDSGYTHLLQHAIRVAEGSITRKQKAKHSAMARYLAIDLATEVAHHNPPPPAAAAARKRSRLDQDTVKNKSTSKAVRTPPTPRKPRVGGNVYKLAMAEKREKEALNKVGELERKLDEMRDEMNALIAKERESNDELQRVHKELMKGLGEIHDGSYKNVEIGIKKIGELDPNVFISELKEVHKDRDSEIKGVQLCSLWQGKIKDPQWYPFQIVEDETGKPERVLKEDDLTLQALKEEWGEEIHDAVVEALTELQDHNSSGCYTVPELWNFGEERKAELHEVIRHIFELQPAKPNKPRKSSNMKGC